MKIILLLIFLSTIPIAAHEGKQNQSVAVNVEVKNRQHQGSHHHHHKKKEQKDCCASCFSCIGKSLGALIKGLIK